MVNDVKNHYLRVLTLGLDVLTLLGIKCGKDIGSIVERNYNLVIQSLSSMLTEYCKLKTGGYLIGLENVTVIKSLATPKLVHLMTALPNP